MHRHEYDTKNCPIAGKQIKGHTVAEKDLRYSQDWAKNVDLGFSVNNSVTDRSLEIGGVSPPCLGMN